MTETDEFVKLVGEMREYQKKFFQSRMSYDLQKAKTLEKKVDECLNIYSTTRNISDQKTLF